MSACADRCAEAAASRCDQRRGSLLFTHFGLSGPVVLDISRSVTALPIPRPPTLVCDFLPDLGGAARRASCEQPAAADGKRPDRRPCSAEQLPRRLVEALMRRPACRRAARRRAAPRRPRRRWSRAFKSTEFRSPAPAASPRPKSPRAASPWTKSTAARCRASSCRPVLRGRNPRPRRPDRRLQLPGRVQHGVWRGGACEDCLFVRNYRPGGLTGIARPSGRGSITIKSHKARRAELNRVTSRDSPFKESRVFPTGP